MSLISLGTSPSPSPSPLNFPKSTLPHRPKSKPCHFPCLSTSKNNPNSIRSPGVPPPDLAAEVLQRIKTHVDELEHAMKKSKKMLFTELCNSVDLSPEEGKKAWCKMSPDEKMGLVKGFVAEWGDRFHPLSHRSVRDMVDEFVAEDDEKGRSPNLGLTGSDSGVFFPGFKKLFMGLSRDD